MKRSDVVVDFGCGPGFYTIPLARKAGRVIGVDVQPEMLEEAARYAARSGVKVEFHSSDGRSIPLLDSSVDLVFMNRVYHEVDDKGVVVKELSRLLKSGGRLAIKEKTKRTLIPFGPPVMMVSEIEEVLRGGGFRVVERIDLGNDTLIIGERF